MVRDASVHIFILIFSLEVLENVNPDLSDSEFIEREEAIDAATPAISDLGDAATPGGDMGEYEGEGDEEEEEEPDGDIDEELAAELDLALGDEEQGDGDEDEDDEDDESEEDEDDEDDEEAQARKLLNEEIRDLEAAVAKKGNEIASSSNPLIRVRICCFCRTDVSDSLSMAETVRRRAEEIDV